MSGNLSKHKRHRRWIGLYRAMEQQKNALRKGNPFILVPQYDRCYELGICWEMVEPRRKMRNGERYKHKGEWYGK